MDVTLLSTPELGSIVHFYKMPSEDDFFSYILKDIPNKVNQLTGIKSRCDYNEAVEENVKKALFVEPFFDNYNLYIMDAIRKMNYEIPTSIDNMRDEFLKINQKNEVGLKLAMTISTSSKNLHIEF